MSSSSTRQPTPVFALGALAAIASASLLYYALTCQKKGETGSRGDDKKGGADESGSGTTKPRSLLGFGSPAKTSSSAAADTDKTPQVKNGGSGGLETSKAVHALIEELDKKGKALFKNKQFMEAAQCFTEALDLISDKSDNTALARQALTLMNNRSAMYEKAGMAELSLQDCDGVLERDLQHTKARLRKLRLLENMGRYYEALVQVCAFQLLFMQANRTNLRMGLPTPQPPIPQSKMEEILTKVLPAEVNKYTEKLQTMTTRPLPSTFTIDQLLRSYSDYNSWMAAAARDGNVAALTEKLEATTTAGAEKVTLLLRRGRRNVYDKKHAAAIADLEEAYNMVQKQDSLQLELEGDTYARLLEWVGMIFHWQHKLAEATECYQKCADLEPTKAILLVKQAGIQMDAGKQEKAMELFGVALGIDPDSVDALLHRSNLFMLKGNPEEAKKDLEKCIRIKSGHVTARLRLASILAAAEDMAGAQAQLAAAEQAEPNSSEIQSYKGELLFMNNEMVDARRQFEKAIQLEPTNPTPYVNTAMAILNTPPPNGQMPDAQAVMSSLEKAIEVDPQFMAAYIQLGQLKLGTATDLVSARKVITLYDQALANCRAPEEIKEVCSMRLLAVAQVDAANALHMATFSM